jgi:tetratricopeptide (TPR) repeat protein
MNSHIPRALDRLMQKLLEKNREERYQTAHELCAGLEEVRRQLDSARDSTRRIRPEGLLGRLGFFLRLAVSVLLLLTIAFFVARRFDWSPIPDQKNLVVLPFTCMGEQEDREGFCDGLVEILTSRLTRLEQPAGSLLVVPATEVFSGGVTNAAQARKLFGANLAVSGVVWSRPEGLQVALNLIDVRRGRQIRSAETFSSWENSSQLVEWAVGEVAVMIRLGISSEILSVLAAGGSTVPRAEDFYIQGRGYLSRTDKPGNIDLAISLFERALSLDPAYARGHAALGEAYWEKFGATNEAHWIENAAASIHRALELAPGLAEARVTLGRIYRGTSRYEDAVREFEGVLALRPSDADALLGLARAYESLGELEKAETAYTKAIEMRTGDWRTYQEQGYFFYFQGRAEEAIEAFKHVLALTPDNPLGYSDLGVMYMTLGRQQEAERAFFESIRAEPNFPAYSNLGTIFFQRRDFQRAAELYAKAAELNETNYDVWGNLAAARRLIPGDDGGAEVAYTRAAQLAEERHNIDPRDGLVAARLAVFYAELGRKDESRAILRELADSPPSTPEVLHGIIGAYESLGDREEALYWLRRALEQGYRIERIETSPAFDSLRSDERYQRLRTERTEVRP